MAEAKQISLLEQTVVDVINKSVSSIEKGAEFLAGQLPDIAEQYLRWMFAKNLTYVLLTFFVLCATIVWMIKLCKIHVKHNEDRKHWYYEAGGPVWIVVFVLCFVDLVFILPTFISTVLECIQIYAAPKVYLIEWAKSFL